MSSSNSFLYNNNAKFQKLKSSKYFSPYCHKVKNSQNNLYQDNKIIKEKILPQYKARVNKNINPALSSANISKLAPQTKQSQEFYRKSLNYHLSEISNKKQKIIENEKKETQSYKKANCKKRIIKSGLASINSNMEDKNKNSNILCSSMAHLNTANNILSKYAKNNKSSYIYKNVSKKKLETEKKEIISNINPKNNKKLYNHDNMSYNQTSVNNLLKSSYSEIFASAISNKTHTKSFFDYNNLNINTNTNFDNNRYGYALTSGNNCDLLSPLPNKKIQDLKKQISSHNRNISVCNRDSYLINTPTEYLPTSPNSGFISKNLNSNIYRNVSNNNRVNKDYPTIIMKLKPMVTKENTTTITNQSNNDSKNNKKDSILTENTYCKNDNNNNNAKSIEEIHFICVNTIQNGRKMELQLEQSIENKK